MHPVTLLSMFIRCLLLCTDTSLCKGDRSTGREAILLNPTEYTAQTLKFFEEYSTGLDRHIVERKVYIMKKQGERVVKLIGDHGVVDIPPQMTPGLEFVSLTITIAVKNRTICLLQQLLSSLGPIHADLLSLHSCAHEGIDLSNAVDLSTDFQVASVKISALRMVNVSCAVVCLFLARTNTSQCVLSLYLDCVDGLTSLGALEAYADLGTLQGLYLQNMPWLETLDCSLLQQNRVVNCLSLDFSLDHLLISENTKKAIASKPWKEMRCAWIHWERLNLPDSPINVEKLSLGGLFSPFFASLARALARHSPLETTPIKLPNPYVTRLTLYHKFIYTLDNLLEFLGICAWTRRYFSRIEVLDLRCCVARGEVLQHLKTRVFTIKGLPYLNLIRFNNQNLAMYTLPLTAPAILYIPHDAYDDWENGRLLRKLMEAYKTPMEQVMKGPNKHLFFPRKQSRPPTLHPGQVSSVVGLHLSRTPNRYICVIDQEGHTLCVECLKDLASRCARDNQILACPWCKVPLAMPFCKFIVTKGLDTTYALHFEDVPSTSNTPNTPNTPNTRKTKTLLSFTKERFGNKSG
ncbi:hypothetical protein NEDG_00750 [Nematocida displodere]|uniref:RING-type domain-containing protein n=1 Tax=Nematocida displodere TaxID=1805483 RepID=A0A177ECF2_9MICR|nr:hypothetical protein NEDG_00750 [Nematocida displodere]